MKLLSPERWLTKATASTCLVACGCGIITDRGKNQGAVTDLLALCDGRVTLFAGLLLALSLLEQSLRDEDLVLGGDSAVGDRSVWSM